MRNTLLKVMGYLLILPVAFVLGSCSPAKATTNPALIWTVEVSKYELKDSLSTVEVVTQYNGTKINVPHQQSPASGNIYLILEMTVSKTGSESVPFDWTKLTVQDNAGNVYPRSNNDTFLEQYNYTPRMTGLEIRFGVNEGWLCFEIPTQAANGKLTLAYTADGSQQEIVLKK
jgi:hypothetical protein